MAAFSPPALEGDLPSDTVKYHGVDDFLDVARRQCASLQQLKTNQQILKFRSVAEKEFDILSADDTRPCKFVKLQYHRPTELLLVKVTPGWDHENQLIAMDVDLKCFTLGSPRNELGDWTKSLMPVGLQPFRPMNQLV
ncbi:hypothetical protein N7516_004654 [Penicillium verrucosum]|uniref:uncharacterized protein n=1 Tax=Penicillium verrucosum TaxID=60171 RepID=UPI0025452D0C|nr:uncharacterized protein N7516_004654 [Penicillium verrucosum]KAJ5944486.1 hypothetical protein N7516_004654 [Penicillium verrucosum]